MLKDAIRNWCTGLRKLSGIAAARVETVRAGSRRAAARIGGWIPPYRTVARLVLWPMVLTGIASFAMLAGYGGYVFTTLDLPHADDDPPLLIYGAPFPLKPGLDITYAHLQERLNRLGYTAVTEEPRQPGEYRLAEEALDLYLRDYPEGHVRATRLRLPLDEGRVLDVRALPEDEPAMFASLEPPLVAGMVGAARQVREWIPLSNIPDHVVRAVLDMEDRRFYHHVGVDPFAVARALWTNVSEGQVVQGGSTITQQLAKNLFFSHERTLLRKAKESLAALMLELKYDKDRILECYLNEIYLGHVGSVAIYGVGEAAQRYFGKPIEAVSIEEAALLAGLIKGPNLFSPIRAPESAKARRDLVLHRLHETGALSSDQWMDAVGQPVTVVSPEQSLAEAPYFVDYLLHQSKEASDNSFPQGTKLYTTLDPILQRLAADAVETGLDRLERQYPALTQNEAELQAALVALDANTGGILAMIGGRRYGGSQFNRAVQARRQPGSLFKPFVYLAAFEAEEDAEGHRITPATLVLDTPVEYQAGQASWSPENYDHQFRGQVTVRAALEQSLNVPAVRVAQATGLARVTEVASRLGLPPSGEEQLSLALGTAEVTLLDITAAFGTLARQGLYVPPTGLRTAQLPTGLTMTRAWPERHLAVSPQSAYLVTTLLKGVVEQGTAAEARTLGLEGIVAGKTGTTDSYRDAWFVGYTPDITIGVWVGYDDGRPLRLTGSQAALPIWVAFAKQIIPPDSPDFPVPSGIVTRNIDPGTGYLANAGCPEAIQEAFIAGTEPTEYCPVHRGSFWERIRETLGL